MKLLLFSDVHCSKYAIERLVGRSPAADILVGAGDFGTMRRGIAATLAPLAQVDKPAILVPGNAESAEELRDAVSWPHGHVLHGSGTVVDGVAFFGFGGGVPVTPFGAWSYDFTEEDATAGLADCPQGCVLVVHSPPYGVLDTSSRGRHLGSTAIRDAVARCQPALVVCGHIHDCAGQVASLDGVPVVNAGPSGVLWDLERASPVNSDQPNR
jgi:Icc-related predicted phosphoesterase